MSKSKKRWYVLYEEKRDATHPKDGDRCADCKEPIFAWETWHPHHPCGRNGEKIMIFVWICEPCHTRIHDQGEWARETGRLTLEFEGRRSTPESPNFFGVKLPT